VEPVHDNNASIYQNSDQSGTPEKFQFYFIGGATGGSGPNVTGSFSSATNVKF
jgi:hypothetical protein